ncbi:MAG: hypothetical protein A4E35_01412 [Methanoregula sp. PtaU1.Bin051]|nr:MAG: hypothetical protein A4E35_01412 [Methanoregula sp. PtaU1.Bin051]
MTLWSLVLSPISIAFLALCIGYLIYAWSKTVAPPFVPSHGKVMPYVGGEVAEAQVFQPGYAFFYVALFFTVVHVAALVIALAPPDAPLWGTAGYLAIIAAAVVILRWEH